MVKSRRLRPLTVTEIDFKMFRGMSPFTAYYR